MRYTTPAQVRRELKRSGMPYGVAKAHGVWYVFGGESQGWYSNSLNVYLFGVISAKEWVDVIRQMEIEFGAPASPTETTQ